MKIRRDRLDFEDVGRQRAPAAAGERRDSRRPSLSESLLERHLAGFRGERILIRRFPMGTIGDGRFGKTGSS